MIPVSFSIFVSLFLFRLTRVFLVCFLFLCLFLVFSSLCLFLSLFISFSLSLFLSVSLPLSLLLSFCHALSLFLFLPFSLSRFLFTSLTSYLQTLWLFISSLLTEAKLHLASFFPLFFRGHFPCVSIFIPRTLFLFQCFCGRPRAADVAASGVCVGQCCGR